MSAAGEVLLEAGNTVVSADDRTGHAEVNLVREASRHFTAEVLAQSTVYARAEPSAMCSGALCWCGVARLVYGLGKQRASEVGREKGEGPQLLFGCRAVFAAGQRPVEVVGPALEDEAEAVLRDTFG